MFSPRGAYDARAQAKTALMGGGRSSVMTMIPMNGRLAAAVMACECAIAQRAGGNPRSSFVDAGSVDRAEV
jgi:hypothetical protein